MEQGAAPGFLKEHDITYAMLDKSGLFDLGNDLTAQRNLDTPQLENVMRVVGLRRVSNSASCRFPIIAIWLTCSGGSARANRSTYSCDELDVSE